MRKAAISFVRQSLCIPRRQFSRASLSHQHPSVRITTLPNKIRIATESTPAHFSSVGLYIDAGSRYEDPSSSGVSHFLDRMAFKVSELLKHFEVLHSFHVITASRQIPGQTQKCQPQWTPWVVKSCAPPPENQ